MDVLGCKLRLLRANDAAGVSRSAWAPLFGSLQYEHNQQMDLSHRPRANYSGRGLFTPQSRAEGGVEDVGQGGVRRVLPR